MPRAQVSTSGTPVGTRHPAAQQRHALRHAPQQRHQGQAAPGRRLHGEHQPGAGARAAAPGAAQPVPGCPARQRQPRPDRRARPGRSRAASPPPGAPGRQAAAEGRGCCRRRSRCSEGPGQGRVLSSAPGQARRHRWARRCRTAPARRGRPGQRRPAPDSPAVSPRPPSARTARGPRQHRLRQPVPAGVPGSRVEREEPFGAKSVVLQQAADSPRGPVVGNADQPAGAVAAAAASARVRDSAAIRSAASTSSGRPRTAPASASAATASPFQPATTLSSRPGCGRPARLGQHRAHPLPQFGVAAGHLPARVQRRAVGGDAARRADIHEGRHGRRRLPAPAVPRAPPGSTGSWPLRRARRRPPCRRPAKTPGPRPRCPGPCCRPRAAGAGPAGSPSRERSQSAVCPAMPRPRPPGTPGCRQAGPSGRRRAAAGRCRRAFSRSAARTSRAVTE